MLRDQIQVLDRDLYVVCEEFGQWDAGSRRIDLLAIDRDANLVVIELKRTENGGHMELQAIRYAAMVANMTFAQAAQSHVGMARALATDVRMRTRRSDSLKLAASIRGVGDAVIAAQRLFDTAKASADEQSEERNAQEREELLRDLGVDDADEIAERAQIHGWRR